MYHLDRFFFPPTCLLLQLPSYSSVVAVNDVKFLVRASVLGELVSE